MARYKPYNLKQDKFIALSYADQVVPGSFEYALNEIVESTWIRACSSSATVTMMDSRPSTVLTRTDPVVGIRPVP